MGKVGRSRDHDGWTWEWSVSPGATDRADAGQPCHDDGRSKLAQGSANGQVWRLAGSRWQVYVSSGASYRAGAGPNNGPNDGFVRRVHQVRSSDAAAPLAVDVKTSA